MSDPDVVTASAYPLVWPHGWKRTRHPERSRFKVSDVERLSKNILWEINAIDGQSPVISTNAELRRDGFPSTRSAPEDVGVAVYWFDPVSKQQRSIACDRWDRIVHNLRAIELTLENLRGIARYCCSEIVERAFRGFAALPPAGDDWRSVLGFEVGQRQTLDDVKAHHRERALAATYFATPGADSYLHTPSYLKARGLNGGGDFCKLRWRDLIEAGADMPEGYWRVTAHGMAFARGDATALNYCYDYNGKLVPRRAPDFSRVTISEAMGRPFELSELMAATPERANP